MSQFPFYAEHAACADTPEHVKRRAFRVDAPGEPLAWYSVDDAPPAWQPYLVRAVFTDGSSATRDSYFHFQFAKRDGGFGPRVHTVDLDDQRVVWRHAPSTLEGLSPSTPCAFLFLTSNLKDVAPGMFADGHFLGVGHDGGTGGRGRWPRGTDARAGAIAVKLAALCTARELMKTLTRDEQELLAELRRNLLANGSQSIPRKPIR